MIIILPFVIPITSFVMAVARLYMGSMVLEYLWDLQLQFQCLGVGDGYVMDQWAIVLVRRDGGRHRRQTWETLMGFLPCASG